MTRSEQLDILQEVAAAFNCLSSIEENKIEVERHACSTIANLIEIPDVHSRFIEERGLPPVVALALSSTDEKCKGDAARVIANLSTNSSIHLELIREGIIEPMLRGLDCSDFNCKQFAALSIANVATSPAAHGKLLQSRAAESLVKVINEDNTHVEVKRYAALAIANLSGSIDNHEELLKEERLLDAIFFLVNFTDSQSKLYTKFNQQ